MGVASNYSIVDNMMIAHTGLCCWYGITFDIPLLCCPATIRLRNQGSVTEHE